MSTSTESLENKDLVIMNEDHFLEGVSFTSGTVCELISSSNAESFLKRVRDEVTLYVPNYKFKDYDV